MIGWVLVVAACGIMFMANKTRVYPREARAKLIAFSMVAGVVGLLLMYKSYNWVGTFWEIREPELQTGSVVDLTSGKRHSAQDDVFYGIMFDAGSTGSRVHAMKFASAGQGKPFKFLDDKFAIIKPGLSSFAKDPEKGAQSLVSLLEVAKNYIPKELHKSTPIALKATAGLRILPAPESMALLDSVRMLFKKYPFRVYDDSVEIMGGMDEGIFSWVTLNFFLEAMGNINNTLGMMDLGGGSTQVTFVPREKATLTGANSKYLTDIDIFGAKHKLYTHRSLCPVMEQLIAGHFVPSQDISYNSSGSLQSACFTPGTTKKWSHAGKEYTVMGLPLAGNRFEQCYKASTALLRGKILHVREIEDDFFCTISYYFDRAVDYGLIEKGIEGKNLTVDQFFEAARTECKKPHPDKPFLCLDMTYMSALLHEGFGFRKDTKLMVIKHVHGREISWALGAMFHHFNKHHIRDS